MNIENKLNETLSKDRELEIQQQELQEQIDELNKKMKSVKNQRYETMKEISMALGFQGVFAGQATPKQIQFVIGLLTGEASKFNVDRRKIFSLTKLECHCIISVMQAEKENRYEELRDEVIEYFGVIIKKLKK